MTKQKAALYTVKVIVHYVKSLSAKNTEKIMPKCLVQSVRIKPYFRINLSILFSNDNTLTK